MVIHNGSFLKICKITGSYLAFLIGSGFATGQEVMQFFSAHGLMGLAGACLAFIPLFYFTFRFMWLGQKHGISTVDEVFQHYFGHHIGRFLSWYILTLFFAVTALMIAGAGATLQQSYDLAVSTGSAIMALAILCSIILGLRRLLDLLGAIGPLLILLVTSVAVIVLSKDYAALSSATEVVAHLDVDRAAGNWAVSSMLFVGLQVLALGAFLPAVGSTISLPRELKYSSLLGPLFYVLGVLIIAAAILANIQDLYAAPIPVLTMALHLSPVYGAFFAVIIFAGIYTTATPLIWTICSRLSAEGTKRYVLVCISLVLAAYIASLTLPFSKLLNILYPSIGILGGMLMLLVLFKDIKHGITCRCTPDRI